MSQDLIQQAPFDVNDESPERQEMFFKQAEIFEGLVGNWVKKTMPCEQISAVSSGSHFQVSILLNDKTELRSPLEFDRKKNLCASDDGNKRAIAEWLRECFKTGQKWEIYNFSTLPDDYFEVHEDSEQ